MLRFTPKSIKATRWSEPEVPTSYGCAVLTRLEVVFDEGGWHEATTVDVWVPPDVASGSADPLAAVRGSARVVFDPSWHDRSAPATATYGPLPRWLETEADHRAWVRQVRVAVQAEAVAEGPSGSVRAEYGDVRVVWVGVVWG